MDVDVVLDLMIHDIDLVLTFVKSPVKEIRAVGLPILSGKVDIANVRMEFESGCVANFTASRVSTERVRKMRFFQPQQYISIDYTRQDVLVVTVDSAAAQAASALNASPPNVASLIQPKQLKAEPEEPLRAELRSFLESVRHRTPPQVPLEDGRRALVVALDILAAIVQHAQRIGIE
jgi:predicted dehydrogenase